MKTKEEILEEISKNWGINNPLSGSEGYGIIIGANEVINNYLEPLQTELDLQKEVSRVAIEMKDNLHTENVSLLDFNRCIEEHNSKLQAQNKKLMEFVTVISGYEIDDRTQPEFADHIKEAQQIIKEQSDE